jgi:hypothetical protein
MFSEIALVAWIIIGAALFAFTTPTRALMLVYVIGILVLPQNALNHGLISFTASLQIEKITACNLAAMLGTLIFASNRIGKYKFDWIDIAMVALIIVEITSSVVNNVGLNDGISQATVHVRLYYPIVLMAKMHLTTAPDLMIALRTIIGGAFCYSFVAVDEFRFSPQLHVMVYGYFQHSFDQFIRWGHFRPIGMLRHAIEFANFMAANALAALWLTFRRQFPPLWGWINGWIVSGMLVLGTALSMTFSAYGMLIGGVILLALLHYTNLRTVLLVLPILASTYMVGRYFDIFDPAFLVKSTEAVDADRAGSLSYRLVTEAENLERCRRAPLLGQSPAWLHAARFDDEKGVNEADDAQWVILLACWGWLGLGLWWIIWSAAIFVAWWYWSAMPNEVRTLAGVIAIMLGLQLIDFIFNAFPSELLLILDIGMVATAAHSMQRARSATSRKLRERITLATEGLPL